MSTTFDVYLGDATIPSFGTLLERATIHLHRFLEDRAIEARPSIGVELLPRRSYSDHESAVERISPSLQAPAVWNDQEYAWFTVGAVPGGTDAYFGAVREVDLDVCLEAPRSGIHEPLIRRCLAVGHRWYFRRSMGQSATINLTYGLLAASLAELTGGILISSDGGWDWERMPALPDEFFSWYFKPESAMQDRTREWSLRCIEYIRGELSS